MLASVLTSLPWLAAVGLPLFLALTGSLDGAVIVGLLIGGVIAVQTPAVPRAGSGVHSETQLAIATGLIGIATFAVLRLAPLYGTATSTISSTGEVATSTGTATLPEVGFPIAIQVLILGIPGLVVFGAVVDARFPRRGRPIVGLAIALCAGLAILGAWSIGLFLLPTLVLSILVFRASRPRPVIGPRGSVSE